MAGVLTRPRRFAPSGRAVAAVALLLAWVAITASGAGQDSDDTNWLNLPGLGWAGYILAIVSTIVLIMAVASAIFGPKQARKPRQTKRQSIWPLVIIILVLLILVQTEPGEPGTAPEAPPVAEASGSLLDSVPSPKLRPGRDEVATLAILVTLAGALVLLLRKPEPTGNPNDDRQPAETLEPVIEQAVTDLTLGEDPRSAVLLAYHRVETALADRSLPRSPVETPTEHIGRVVGRIEPDPAFVEPLQGLARLYELARFSKRAITVADQRAAAESLQRVQAKVDHL